MSDELSVSHEELIISSAWKIWVSGGEHMSLDEFWCVSAYKRSIFLIQKDDDVPFS